MVEKSSPNENSTDDRSPLTESNTDSIRTVPLDDFSTPTFPEAFAAQVGERDLWIANIGGIKPDNLSKLNLSPKFVVSVSRTATEATTDHHPLKDAYVNGQQKFTEAVETARQRIQQDGTVIVNCAAGISRSTTVMATAVAAEEEQSFEAVVEEIRQIWPRADPHPKLQLNAQAYLATVTGHSEAQQRLEELADSAYPGEEDKELVEDLLSQTTTDNTSNPATGDNDNGGVSDGR